jgi:hypothetical protein
MRVAKIASDPALRRRLFVQVLLKAAEDAADLVGAAEVGDGVGDAVVYCRRKSGVSLS